MTSSDPALAAALVKLTEHAARLDECQIATAGLAGAVTDLRTLVEEQGRLIEWLSQRVPGPDDDGGQGYKPRQPVPWWKLTEAELQKERDHLSAWVEQVYRPWYGHLAAMLGACWQDHGLVLVGLDVASQMHSVLWFQPKRPASLLAAQAEFQTRIMPAFAEQWRAETNRCTHRAAPANGNRWAGGR